MTRQNKLSHTPDLIISATDSDRLFALAQAVLIRSPQVGQDLLSEILRARVVAESDLPRGAVRMNSEVEFRDDTRGKSRRVRLVYPHQADIESGRISILTPVGTALIGLLEGQSITWNNWTGEPRSLTVERALQPAD